MPATGSEANSEPSSDVKCEPVFGSVEGTWCTGMAESATAGRKA